MAWYDTLISGLNTAGQVYDAARPFIDIGASIYDRNQTRSGISDAWNQYSNYANRSLNTLGDIYQQGAEATAPYREAGTDAVSGYTNLMNDPSQIYNDPGYLWRKDQGAEAIDRAAAAGGYRGSGNRDIALMEYGQNYATSELDAALSRYLPMVNAGLEGTRGFLNAGQTYAEGVGQVNRGLGEAAAGAAIGSSGTTSRMITDLLGIGGGGGSGGNPLSALAGGASAVRDLWTSATGAAGSGAAGSGAAGAGAAGAGAAAPGVTVGTATPPPTFVGTPIGGAGTAGGALPPGTGVPTSAVPGWNPFTNGVLGGDAAAMGVVPAGLGTSGSVSTLGQFMGSLGVGAAIMGGAALLGSLDKIGKGGAADSAKAGKWFPVLQQAKTPEERARLIDNMLSTGWRGETETDYLYVVKPMLDNGLITEFYPGLWSADSQYNLATGKWTNAIYSPEEVAERTDWTSDRWKSYRYEKRQWEGQKYNRPRKPSAGVQGRMKLPKEMADRMGTGQQKQDYLANVYRTIRNSGYRGDLTKLEDYLGPERIQILNRTIPSNEYTNTSGLPNTLAG